MPSISPQNSLMNEPKSLSFMPSFNSNRSRLLPMTHEDTDGSITCYDDFGNPKTHGPEQRYVSPTTGACRKLRVQSVNPIGPNEFPIKDHTGQTNRLAMWLFFTNPFHNGAFFKWTGKFLWFSFILLWSAVWLIAQILAQLFLPKTDLGDDFFEDSAMYDTGIYKPYTRKFSGQLWAARSSKEYSSRDEDQDPGEQSIPTHSLYPRLLMMRDPVRDQWSPCTDPKEIIQTKYIAISYHSSDAYRPGVDEEKEKEKFIQEVRAAVLRLGKNYNAYWLDLECLGELPGEKKLDLYCMADVYRGAEATLVMLGNSLGVDGSDGAWKRWGGRVWTLPEALLSQRLYYKFRNRDEIESMSLHHLANSAYTTNDLEQAIINAYSGKDPLERLERLTLLKSAIWRRGITLPESIPSGPARFPSIIDIRREKTTVTNEPYPASRVYALMGFFEHRIQPNFSENDLLALARLSMANDNDRIAERMVSLLPNKIEQTSCWYADTDVYAANLWDILPEIQVAGVTKNGALVLDGCKAASIRWKDFPGVTGGRPDSVRRTLIGFVAYLSWPTLLAGLVAITITTVGGIILIVFGTVLVLAAPGLLVFSEGGRIVAPQPWFIGVKGVLDIDKAAGHLYGGGNKGHYPRIYFTPSGSEFAVPDPGPIRAGSKLQYEKAKEAERGSQAGRMYTLIDTYSSTIYYFSADRPPTVCLFTGREGGLGRFVLCSERCSDNELHKETVLRMPTEVSQRMELCGWVALG